MLSLSWQIFIGVYCVYSLIMLFFVIRTYRRLSFLNELEVKNSLEFPGFTRDDYSKWSACQLFFGGLFLLPLRLILAILTLILLYLFQNILCICFCNFSFVNGINRCHKMLSNLLVTVCCRFILFLGGFYWISYRKQIPREYNTTYFNNFGEVPYATYVSNHISWADILFYLGHPKAFSFISNHKVKNFCFIGAIATLIQCIFVNRSSKQSKQQCFEDLKTRVENIKINSKGKLTSLQPAGGFCRGNGFQWKGAPEFQARPL